jgi:hypothetical protein
MREGAQRRNGIGVRSRPMSPPPTRSKANCERATAELAALQGQHRWSLSSIARLEVAQYFGVPAVRALFKPPTLVGLVSRDAGLKWTATLRATTTP